MTIQITSNEEDISWNYNYFLQSYYQYNKILNPLVSIFNKNSSARIVHADNWERILASICIKELNFVNREAAFSIEII